MPVAPGTPEAARLIRGRARRLMLGRFPAPLRPLAALGMAVAWPVQTLADALGMARNADFPGAPPRRLARRAWAAALRHNVPPLEFFAYRMPERPEAPPDAWLIRAEVVRLNEALAGPAAARLAADKHAFARFCAAQGLPAVPTLARIAGGPPGPAPAEPDLVLKPESAANARGIEHWRSTPDGYRRLYPAPAVGEPFDWPGLAAQAAAARAGPVLVQPLLALHPALRPVVASGSPAARLVTGLPADGPPELLHAVFARPYPGHLVSNGGARRRIDPASGRLLAPEPGRLRPAFGAPDPAPDLDGVVLPDWPRARELALGAHRALPDRAVLLGWDLAFTPDGPVLIEVNLGISCYMSQMDSLEPAGGARVAEVLASWLR